MRPLALVLTLLLSVHPVLASDGADWFQVAGVSFAEAVGTGTTYVVVTKSSADKWAVVAAGEEFAPGMTVKKIGAEQVMVSRGGGEQAAAPILRQQIPADVMVAAICRLYNQNLVIAGEVPKNVAFIEGLLNYKQELPGLLQSLGMELVATERAIVIRKPGSGKTLPPAAGAKQEAGYQGHHVRTALGPLFESVSTQTQRTFRPKQAELTATVVSADLAPDELAGLLAAVLGTEIPEDKPKPDAGPGPGGDSAGQAGRTSASAGLEPLPVPSDPEDRAFQQAVLEAKKGDRRNAAAILLKVVKEKPAVAPRVTNLLGKLLWQLGRKDQARKVWMRTLKADPNDAFARKALEKTAAAPK
ncbi:MAG: tetratricopeptide repeat protein [Candidatus Riflebacteria bacterium]|nr:tetratricopeptide repeat protein [Candidatus Riflebacteria bacterium]